MLRQPTEPAGSEPAASATSQTLQGVLFDMDGLLVDSEPIWFEAECAVMARLHGEWSAADQHALVGGSLSHTVSYLLARAERPASREEVGRWLVEGMTSLLMSRNLTMLPGARELLAEVRAAGLPHALVTSSERPIMDAVLLQLGVGFTATVCADDVATSKPAPDPYLLAASLLGADPRSCVALEDSPNGVASAEAAGCSVVAVPSLVPIPARPGRVVAASLREVDLALLRSLVPSG
jgi:HAD superfamily hydrolase (TIGR01509 family)